MNHNKNYAFLIPGQKITGVRGNQAGQWYHLAGTLKDGINATLYVNAENNGAELPPKRQENPPPIYVGSWEPGSTEIDAFHGYIDELRVSDEVLGPDKS